MATTDRIHYYHADACAFGGTFEDPNQNIAPQAPMSLSPSGGTGSANSANFLIDGIASYDSATTEVSGVFDDDSGSWITTSTATIQGLNIFDGLVTADCLVATVCTEHPLVGNNPKVSFSGTSFQGLEIGGEAVDVTLNLNICAQGNGSAYPAVPCVGDDSFLSRVAAQYSQMNNANDLPAWVTDRTIPSWIADRYKASAVQQEKYGYILSSVVQGTSGQFAGRPFVNVLEIPELGRLFLGELLVDRQSFRLTMARFEVDDKKKKKKGQVGVLTAYTNGGTMPPG